MFRELATSRLTWEGLAILVAGIFLPFVGIALVWSLVGPDEDIDKATWRTYFRDGPAATEELLRDHLLEEPGDVEGWLLLLKFHDVALISSAHPAVMGDPFKAVVPQDPKESAPFFTDDELDQFLENSTKIPPGVLRAYGIFRRSGLEAALLQLERLSGPYSWRVATDLCSRTSDRDRRLHYAKQWYAAAPEDAMAVDALLGAVEEEALGELLEDPAIREHASLRALRGAERKRGRFIPAAWYAVLDHLLGSRWQTLLACAGVALCWATVVLHLASAWGWGRWIWVAGVSAVALGIVSAWLTLGAVIVMDDLIPLDEAQGGLSHTLLASLLIGIREEVLKLLFFVPLIPWLVKKTNLQIIVVASLVGLGFAVEENLNYYERSAGSAVVSRYLTANFFHMALTGYAGYYLTRAIRDRGEAWHEFFSQFSKVIIVHAAYDLFLIEPSLREYSILSMILFIVIAQQYLRLLHYLRPSASRSVSPTKLFVASLTFATGIHYLFMAGGHGVFRGFSVTGAAVVGVVIISVVFFREFGERIE